MKIRSFHVEGFGILRDWRVDGLGDGLTVFHGPNEAGKSTLLAFLRGMLFGFPDRRSREPRYEPVDGVAHGGRMVLAGADGVVSLERFVGRRKKASLTLEDGSAGDEGDLALRLGNADARLFRSVFAFGLDELTSAGALADADVQDHVFAAGLTGAGRASRAAIRDLAERADELFAAARPRKGTVVKALAAELRELDAEIALRGEAAARYPELLAAEQALADELGALRREAEGRRFEEQRARQLIELWEQVVSPLADARQQLAKLGPVPALAPGAEARLERALAGVAAAERARVAVRGEREVVERELAELSLDERLPDRAERVAELAGRLVLVRSQREALDELDARRAELAEAVRAALAEGFAGAGGEGEEALREADLERETREGLVAFVEAGAGLESRARDLATERRLRRERHDAALAEAAGAAAAAARIEELGDAELDARAVSLAELRERASRPVAEQRGVPRDPWLLPLSGLAGLCALGVGLAVGLGRFDVTAWLPLAGLLASLALLAARLRRLTERRRASASAREHERAQVAAHARRLGLASIDAAALERAEEALERDRALRLERASQLHDAEHARAEAASIERALVELERRDGHLAAERAELAGELDAWLEARRLPASLALSAFDSPGAFAAGVGARLEALRRGRDALARRDALEREVRELRDGMAAWAQEARGLLAELDVVAEGPELEAALVSLRERCEADRAARERRQPLLRQRETLAAREQQMAEGVESAAALRDAVLREAGVDGVEAFQARLRDAERGAQLGARITAAEEELSRRLSGLNEEEAAAARRELGLGRSDEWEEAAAVARAAAVAAEGRRDEVLRQHENAARARARLEDSSDLAELELRRSELAQRLEEAVAEWRRLTLGRALLETALERFEQDRQPGVLREASRLLEHVTGGRYVRIVSAEPAGFAVLDRDRVHRQPAELSRGTREQLYLCLRLGLAAELARRGTALPLVMDDVLVNFDDERAGATAQALALFAREHQVLYFTCTSHTRDLLARQPGVSLRAMG